MGSFDLRLYSFHAFREIIHFFIFYTPLFDDWPFEAFINAAQLFHILHFTLDCDGFSLLNELYICNDIAIRQLL